MNEIRPIFESRPVMIAGPCSAESEKQMLSCARRLKELGVGILRAGIWKPRTRPGCFEGPGEIGLEWMKAAKAETGMCLTTEVACAHHVEAALKAGIDILWIGARTATSPFAVQEIADCLKGTDTPVMVKNPMTTDIDLWIGAVERLSLAGLKRIAAIHRGFSSYNERTYRCSPQGEVPIELRRRIPGLQILCDPSHMAGRRELVAPLAQMALDMKADGLFIEVHPTPECALSDSRQQLTPDQFKELTRSLVHHREPTNSDADNLRPYRQQLDSIDDELVSLLARRFDISRQIGDYKHLQNLAILQPERYKSLADDMVAKGTAYGISEKCIRTIFETIHAESIRHQMKAL
ncbi:MAG: bifunctional 3-deoxy-7-phosphoheptulonate synthase/chorismate mutase type II [Bacteroidetes bacterium]|nr:bifunctional 3-deoxy-7-phosphoheptulonate synthase/chorismate mutase type II [Candidatus Colenecus caballi]